MNLKRKIRIIIDANLKEKKKIRREKSFQNLLKSNNNKKRIVLMMTPEYGNLGDHAIAYSEILLLEKLKKEYEVIEITQYQLIYDFKKIMSNINNEDIILITGGGYFGDLWKYDGEYIVRNIIKKLKKNKIIILPMSMYFSENKIGKKELNKTKRIYSKHKNLHICCRESQTYNLIRLNNIGEKIYLVPDMVLNMDMQLKPKQDVALFCFRNDKEKKHDLNIEHLKRIVTDSTGYEVKSTTTRLGKTIKPINRENELVEKINEFSKSKLVITDRLHGMLFAYITHTPCLAFDNISKKISGVYQWIKNCEYIQVVENMTDCESAVKRLINVEFTSPNIDFNDYYDLIINLINIKEEYDECQEQDMP